MHRNTTQCVWKREKLDQWFSVSVLMVFARRLDQSVNMTIFLQGNIKSQRGNGLENIKLVVSDNYLPTLDTNILIEENRNLFFGLDIVRLGSWSWSMVLVKFKIHGQRRTRADAIIQMYHQHPSDNFLTSYSKAKTLYLILIIIFRPIPLE